MRSIFSPFSTTLSSVANLDSETFAENIKTDENAVLIDVRTRMEHDEERIPSSILVDIYSPEFRSKIEELDKSKNIYLYCRSGNRSYQAGLMMSQMGFKNIFNLASGIIGWFGDVERG